MGVIKQEVTGLYLHLLFLVGRVLVWCCWKASKSFSVHTQSLQFTCALSLFDVVRLIC